MTTLSNSKIQTSAVYVSTDESVKLNCIAFLDYATKKVIQLQSGTIYIDGTFSGSFYVNQNADGTSLLFGYNDIPQGSSQNQENLSAMIAEIETQFE